MIVLGTAVLIKPDILPERTKTGALVIPENSKEMLPQWGTIIECGKACKEAKKGDHVHFPRKSASIITIDDVDYYFTTEHKLMYMQEKDERIHPHHDEQRDKLIEKFNKPMSLHEFNEATKDWAVTPPKEEKG